VRTPIEPLETAKPWHAQWDRPGEAAKLGQDRQMLLDASGLSAGVPLLFSVVQEADCVVVPAAELPAASESARGDGAGRMVQP